MKAGDLVYDSITGDFCILIKECFKQPGDGEGYAPIDEVYEYDWYCFYGNHGYGQYEVNLTRITPSFVGWWLESQK